MKSLTLIKKSKFVQVGHLYEHMYCNVLKSFLYDSGLLRARDYFISGKTYDDGYITVEIELHTEEAVGVVDKIINLPIDASNPRVLHFALQQIIAEEESILFSKAPDRLVEELNALNTSLWEAKEGTEDHKLGPLLSDVDSPLTENDEFVVETDSLSVIVENSAYSPVILGTLQDRIVTQLGYFEDEHRDTDVQLQTDFVIVSATEVSLRQLEDLIRREFKRIADLVDIPSGLKLATSIEYKGQVRQFDLVSSR